MSDFLHHLREFNTKERYHLLRFAIGGEDWPLSPGFKDALKEGLGLTVPPCAYWAIDYHLDWLYAALVISAGGDPACPSPNDARIIEANQRDIDLVVAWPQGDWTHLLLAEAKFVSSFDNKQMASKAERLQQIFEPGLVDRARVKPHFCLVAPKQTKYLKTEGWLDWMKRGGDAVMINMPKDKSLKKVTQCDKSGNKKSRGSHWKVEPV